MPRKLALIKYIVQLSYNETWDFSGLGAEIVYCMWEGGHIGAKIVYCMWEGGHIGADIVYCGRGDI